MENLSSYEVTAREFLKSCGAEMKICRAEIVDRFPNEKDRSGYRWRYRVRIDRKGVGSWSFNFYGSISEFQQNKNPGKYSVLACIQKYDVGTFEEFCSDYGYDQEPLSEYPRVRRIYAAVQREYANVKRIFGDVMDDLDDIQ